ncbi:class I SAM-dependent methyltransferase [Pseudophaeobacter leonis]|uniref:class I SAM-dependent methyltransferase n=1 Tax=Pseudophaeobacter leonis TaxID=1144477 RepID=UPI00111BEBA0|nr:methyltransferase domain-containing protein [Pseudophaeobacter leonis]
MEKTFLNLGSGPRLAMPTNDPLFRGWTEFRVDISPETNPDAVASLVDLKGVIADNSVEIVYCSHVIEHFYAHEVPLVLAEVARVLRRDGVAVFRCPDLAQVVQNLDPTDLDKPIYSSPAGDITILDIIYGHRESVIEDGHHMAHRSGFTEEYLAKHLLDAGFEEVRTQTSSSMDFWTSASFESTRYLRQAERLLI